VKSSRRILIIFNPAARSDRAYGFVEDLKLLPRNVTVRHTERAGDAEAIAERAASQGFDTIIAAGGDGTVNEVVNGMAESGCQLGILPVGTMNVFATELGIPQNDIKKALSIALGGHAREVDLARANDEYFVQLAGVGLDAAVVGETSSDSKKNLGPVSYIFTLAHVAARKAPVIRMIDAEGTKRSGSFLLVGNGRFYGGPFVLFNEARLDDGLLDVLVFKKQSHWDIIRYLQAIAFGAHPELEDVEYFQTSSLTVECTEHVPVEVDGEMAGALPYRFSFVPRKLKVLVPEQSLPS